MTNVLKSYEKAISFFARKEVLLFLCLIILLVPSLFRDSFFGEDGYYNSRIAQLIINEKALPGYDSLSFGDRNLFPMFGWPFLIALVSYIFGWGVDSVSKILPTIFGVISFLIFYSLIKNLKPIIRMISSLLLIISPTFLYLFSTSNEYVVAVFLLLLSLYFYDKNKYASYASFGLISLFSLKGLLISFIFILIYLLYTHEIKNITIYIVASLAFLLAYLPFVISNGIPYGLNLFNFNNILFDFGNMLGYGIFIFILSFFGLAYLWREKYEHLSAYLVFAIFITLSFFIKESMLYFNFILVLFAAYGLLFLIDKRWQSSTIGYLTVLIFISGLLFSTFSYFSELRDGLPTQAMIDGFKFLSDKDGVVFSHYTRGVWINSISQKKNFVDSNFYYAPNLGERLFFSNELFNAMDVTEVTDILDKSNIKYIYLDKYMKNALWGTQEKGLLYILRYSNLFKRVYSNDDVEIWEYVKNV